MRPLVLAAVLVAGCREGATARIDSGIPVSAQAAPDAGWVLTEAKLAAWLDYQRAMLAPPGPREDAGRGDGGSWDGGAKRDGAGGAVLRAVLERARREASLREEAGLSEADVDRIEELVGAVVTQRNIARLTGADAVRDVERAAVALKGGADAGADGSDAGARALAEPRARALETATLTAEKARFGEEAVRVVLTREQEVTKTWDALVDARGGTR